MITKKRIKEFIRPGCKLNNSELIDKIQEYLNKYDYGAINMKHVAVGLLMATGLSHSVSTYVFYKLQSVDRFGVHKCFVCGENWENEGPCKNCLNEMPF